MAVIELVGTMSELQDLVEVCSEEELDQADLDTFLYEVQVKHFDLARKVGISLSLLIDSLVRL